MTHKRITEALEVALLTEEDSPVIAGRLASDPDGLAATGANAPREETALQRLIKKSIGEGSRLWRVRVGGDLFGAIVGDDPFSAEENRLFVWLDPRHRGDDLGIKLVAETIRRLAKEGRERVVAKPPRSNYAALRILNALEFIYVGEEDDDSSADPKVLFERGTTGGPSTNPRIHRDLAG